MVKIFIGRIERDRMMDATTVHSQVIEAFQASAKAGHVDVVKFFAGERKV